MPYTQCPFCKKIVHVSVKDTSEWIKKIAPQWDGSNIIPLECFACWKKHKLEVEAKSNPP